MNHAGSAIRAMREAQELSLRDLAQRAGVNPGYLSLVERGLRTPTPRWLTSIKQELANGLIEKGAA